MVCLRRSLENTMFCILYLSTWNATYTSLCKIEESFLQSLKSGTDAFKYFKLLHICTSVDIFIAALNQVARLNPEKSIPVAVLKDAKGLAVLIVAKAGMLLSYKLGTGLVVARRSDSTWSAPSAIVSLGLGWGAQVTEKLTVHILKKNTTHWHFQNVTLSSS